MMKGTFVCVVLSILFAQSSCNSRHHEQLSDQVDIDTTSVTNASEGLGLVGLHYIVGDATDPNAQTIASAVSSNRNSRHEFEELFDKRPLANQILSLQKTKESLRNLAEDGSATLLVHPANADEIIAAVPEGFKAERVNQGYAKLIRSKDQTPGLSEAEQHFGGPNNIVVIQLKKTSDPSAQTMRPPLTIKAEGTKWDTLFKAYDAKGVLVGMASFRLQTLESTHLSFFDIGDAHQGKGYGREFFNHVVQNHTDKGISVSIIDASETSAGQKLYGGESTLDNFDVEVNFKGYRQSYILSKKKGDRGKKHYEKNSRNDPTLAYGAIKYINNNDYASGNAGSTAELMGYLTEYPDAMEYLILNPTFTRQLETSLEQTQKDGELDFYKALSQLKEMLDQYKNTHPPK